MVEKYLRIECDDCGKVYSLFKIDEEEYNNVSFCSFCGEESIYSAEEEEDE
jgi:predicted nucleic-acid-binding Zn-ribbon protein